MHNSDFIPGHDPVLNPHSVLDVERATFLENFPHTHFRVRHNLAGHPLFSVARLIELAMRHPPHLTEYYGGNAAVSQDPRSMPRTGMGLVETLENIDRKKSWAVFRHPELDPEYRALLRQTMSELLPLSDLRQAGGQQPEAYIFIASPGSVTPFHMDDEHNFLLHISGEKDFHAWSLANPQIVNHLHIERYYAGQHRNLFLPPQFSTPEKTFTLKPGDGVYVPVHAPHWVQNGDAVAVSFSVTFRTRKIAREARIHLLNARLRGRGFNPRPCGASAFADTWKYWAARLGHRMVGRPQHY